MEAFENVVRLDAADYEALYNLGRANIAIGKMDEARKIRKTLKELSPTLGRHLETHIKRAEKQTKK